jgi:hypothetical protein
MIKGNPKGMKKKIGQIQRNVLGSIRKKLKLDGQNKPK